MQSIILLSKNKEIYQQIIDSFASEAHVRRAENDIQAVSILKNRRSDYLFIDISELEPFEKNSYKSYLQSFLSLYPTLEIIIITPIERIREAVRAVKDGASDYILFPIKPDEADYVIRNLQESLKEKSELDYLRGRFHKDDIDGLMTTSNDKMKVVYSKLKSVAPTISTVLLLGETGTGKGVLARLIHNYSNRKDSGFIDVHCGAIPDTLLESELFGHEKGSFTGAVKRKLGKFEIADHGTIFLDEIGTITPSAQIKLLQVLQDGNFQRVGGESTINTDARIIAATNVDLKEMSESGLFRKDLYYRLNVFPIEIPPLRDRPEDIPHLAMMFLDKLNRINSKEIKDISSEVMETLIRYPWPGNIRELENLIERAYILENTYILQPESFPADIFESGYYDISVKEYGTGSLAYIRRKGIEEIERNYLQDLMLKNRGRIKQSAEIAGISTRQIHKLLTKYGIRKEDFKDKR